MNNRVIKFRAWVKDVEQMVIVDYIDFPITTICHSPVDRPEKDEDGEMIEDKISDVKDTILMQFTGLKDKNGKEIYCSDILRHPDVVGSEFYVRWNNERARFQLESKERKELMGQLFNDEYVVIGNEFEGLQNIGMR